MRLSGRDAFAVAAALLQPRTPRPLQPWRLRLCTAHAADGGEAIDEVLAVRMPGPASYTGEDVVEVHCHGSPVVVERIVEAAVAAGARAAERGEFSRRAVLNGRMDLAQAEAVADLIDAKLGSGAAAAWRQLQGALSGRLAELRGRLLGVLAGIEANVDFSDEDLPEDNAPARTEIIDQARAEIAALLDGFEIARRHREGLTVVATGPPNAGKSSLVNALLGFDRMIVSDEAGTTRDSVDETVELAGMAFVVTDTAGLRTTPSTAESAAVTRARARVADADIVVLVLDASKPPAAEEREIARALVGARAGVIALNKSDLGRDCEVATLDELTELGWPLVATSALSGQGCDELAGTLVSLGSRALGGDPQPVAVSRLRHRTALRAAHAALGRAIDRAAAGGEHELAALELREALARLAEITDAVDNEDVLDRIFGEFCIGK